MKVFIVMGWVPYETKWVESVHLTQEKALKEAALKQKSEEYAYFFATEHEVEE